METLVSSQVPQSEPKFTLIGPPLETAAERPLKERLRARKLVVNLVLAPRDASQSALWRARAAREIESSTRTIVVEPSARSDPDGQYRRDLDILFAELSPAARESCIPCSLEASSDLAHSAEGRPPRAGPRGRPIANLTDEATLDSLQAALRAKAPRLEPLSLAKPRVGILSDHPAEVDGIGMLHAVDAFVDLISAPSTTPPIVASIEGAWGVGKSTFLKLVRKRIQERSWGARKPGRGTDRDPPGIRTVWFNAWSNEGQIAAFSSFALSLIAEIEKVHVLQRLWFRFRLACRRFNWATGWKDLGRLLGGLLLLVIAGILGYFLATARLLAADARMVELVSYLGTGALGLTGVQRIRGFFGSPLDVDLAKHVAAPDYEAKRSQGDHLYDDIAKIIEVYTSGASRLYVFVDDLDRAAPDQVAELTQAIGVILAKAGTKMVYVLALDREKVAAALTAKHKDVAGIMASAGPKGAQPLDFGQRFLEKLIQLPFRVPAPGAEELCAWIKGMVHEGQQHSAADLGEVVGMVAYFLGANPRRAKQFVNLLQLRLRLLQCKKGDPPALSLHQLAKITALEILYPFFVNDLVAEPALLNAVLIGAGPACESEAYRRWSACTELIDLLCVTLPCAAGGAELSRTDCSTSLLDLDVRPLLRIGGQAVDLPLAPLLAHPSGPAATAAVAPAGESPYEVLVRYGREYDRIRLTETAGPERTATLDRLFDDMARIRGVTEPEAHHLMDSGSAGLRVAALASCLAEQHASTGQILRRVLEGPPRSKFEAYQALRIAKVLWSILASEDRQALARTASVRWLYGTEWDDIPLQLMTRDILSLAEAVELGDDFQIAMPDGVCVRLQVTGHGYFGNLLNLLYQQISELVQPYHYGSSWWLVDERGVRVRHRRELDGGLPGLPMADNRSLLDVGIRPGTRLRLELRKEVVA